MRGFLEKCGDGEKTDRRQTEDRDETEFIGPIPPVGVGPKKFAKFFFRHPVAKIGQKMAKISKTRVFPEYRIVISSFSQYHPT